MSYKSRAKVFISCGQRKGTEELEIANSVAVLLDELGFDPYIAVQEQTLRGLKENIFQQLASSEYFLFIDFVRDEIKTEGEKVHRGSLFSHQELAIASFLNKRLIALQEFGVKRDDGLIGFLQGNLVHFQKREEIIPNLRELIARNKWEPSWRDLLDLQSSGTNFVDATRMPQNRVARFFHIDVRNLNPYDTALNCYAYIEKLIDLTNNRLVEFESIELKWKGYTLPNATIVQNGMRKLDAFWLFHDDPTLVRFNIFTDYGGQLHGLRGKGALEVTYIVISENFPIARQSFIIKYGESLQKTQFYRKD